MPVFNIKSKKNEQSELLKRIAELENNISEQNKAIKDIESKFAKFTKITKSRLKLLDHRSNVSEHYLAELSIENMQSKGAWHNTEKLEGFSAQEKYWASLNGTGYTFRNHNKITWESRTQYWKEILDNAHGAKSFLELGCNVGSNLRAINALKPEAKLSAVEINAIAAEQARKALPNANITNDSILNFESNNKWDFVYTRGVLIHIKPEFLPAVYERFNKLSSRYIMMYENYSATPQEYKDYGHTGHLALKDEEIYLFYRDFAQDFNDHYPNWKRVAEGRWPKPKAGEAVKVEGEMIWTLFERTN